jgi:hypothetical protein
MCSTTKPTKVVAGKKRVGATEHFNAIGADPISESSPPDRPISKPICPLSFRSEEAAFF